MRTILSINHSYFLLPAGANVTALIKALGQPMERNWVNTTEYFIYQPTKAARVELTVVDDDQVCRAAPKAKKMEEKP